MSLPFQFQISTIIDQKRTTRSAIDTIKSWLRTTSLPQIQDEFIVLFLISSLNEIPKTKKNIEYYFKTKNAAPKIYSDCDLETEELKKVINIMSFCVVPKRIDGNTGIIFVRLEDDNYRNVDVVAVIKLCTMLTHLIQISDPPNDILLIIDMKGIGFMHLTCIRMKSMLQHLNYVQDGVPLITKNVYILNSNYIFERVISIFKIFIKSEVLKIIEPQPSGMQLEDFVKKHVPVDCLPEDYGGNLPELKHLKEETLNNLRKFQEFFKAEEELRRYHETSV